VWDDFIYRMAYRSVNRVMHRSPGRAYLLLLLTAQWLEENPVSDVEREAAATVFGRHIQRPRPATPSTER
jgi:hypothetical protein